MRKPKDHRLFVSLSPVEKRILRSVAKEMDLTMSQLVRRMIRKLDPSEDAPLEEAAHVQGR